jgi:hypothetical protein
MLSPKKLRNMRTAAASLCTHKLKNITLGNFWLQAEISRSRLYAAGFRFAVNREQS